MKMKKWLSVTVIGLLTAGALAACGAGEGASNGGGGSEDAKVLKMGTSADYPPFEYIDTAKGDSEPVGFDIDLAKAIGKELGYEVQVVDMEFGSLIPSLQSKKVDFVLAGMTPTEERKKNIDFSDVYYEAKNVLVSKKDEPINSIEELNGKTVGVQTASIQEDEAKTLSEEVDIKIESRDRIPQLIQEMKSNRIDVAIIEDTVAKGYVAKDDTLQLVETGREDSNKGSAIAFPKGSKLTDEFNKELQEMKESGELEELIVKWFDSKE
ncbi:transporter substrate-binding domain-containing protein [Priestia flexa]|uniref:Transporter substrate-binding domain-containing protein n=2 Tax=Priestia flexa TaxID=86664 RepID=A0ABU4JBK1_9BACI|nr:transporter substrate-binding domain-containing protein [Priestia flexa]MDW8518396.1 transporter substrate-binding domain-containing protein [Priestia flexa]MED4590685.1 transporter substrate-binding domain-containing protein [Priestia flexa]WHX78336.1 transporter substrate-binding domain-containing protein [Priestia flexa]